MNPAAYEALRERTAILDLTGRGLILVKEEDRTRLLHAMTTNVIEGLQAGQGNVALFLNDKGRIIADLFVLCRQDEYLLDTEPATRQLVYEHLDHYIIMDVVELEDVSDSHCVLGVEGPEAANLLSGLGAPVPEAANSHTAWGEAIVARFSFTGGPGFRIYAPLTLKESLVEKLQASGATPCDLDTAEVVRLEYGKPRHGAEVSDQHLVHEAQLLSHVSFSKGCYLGQEIVERVRSRGNVNRLLTRLLIDGDAAPPPETPVQAGEKEAGKLLSAAYSPAAGKTIAYALLRAEHIKGGSTLEVDGRPATIAPDGRIG